MSSLLVANADNFLKYEYNDEAGSLKEMYCSYILEHTQLQ